MIILTNNTICFDNHIRTTGVSRFGLLNHGVKANNQLCSDVSFSGVLLIVLYSQVHCLTTWLHAYICADHVYKPQSARFSEGDDFIGT